MDGHFFSWVRKLRFRGLKTHASARLAVVRQSRRGGSASCDGRGACPPLGRADGFADRWSCRGHRQLRYAHQIIGGADQVRCQLSELAASIAGAPEVGHGLNPAEDLLDPLALFLADGVARVPQRSSVQRRAARAAVVGRDMWSHVQRPAGRDEIRGIISLVRAHSDAAGPRQVLINHFDRGASLGRAVGFDDLKIDQQSVAVLHQRMTRIAQLGFLARPLGAQGGSGVVGGSLVRVGRRSPWKLVGGLPGSSGGLSPLPSLGLKLLSEAQASISVPSTVKWSSLISPRSCACPTILAKNSRATSCSNNRARLREKLLWSKLGSSRPISKNQRNRRL